MHPSRQTGVTFTDDRCVRDSCTHMHNDIDVDVICRGSVVAVKEKKRPRSSSLACKMPPTAFHLREIVFDMFRCKTVRSLLRVYMQNTCLCAGGRMYVKVHEDCGLHVPMNLHNKRHNIYQTPWTPGRLRFLPAGGT